MNFWTSFFNKATAAAPKALLAILLLSLFACAAPMESALPSRGGEPSQLRVASPSPAKASPQVAMMSMLAWSVAASGGEGGYHYVFALEKDGAAPHPVQEGPMPVWTWRPVEAGLYRVRAVVTDAAGNEAQSPWSEPFTIAPPLDAPRPIASLSGPRMAGSVQLSWGAEASGGVGEHRYRFELEKGGEKPEKVQDGLSSEFVWRPAEAGVYRVRTVVADEAGNEAQSPWSEPYSIAPPLRLKIPVAGKSSPQVARMTRLLWSVSATGGVGGLRYVFELEKDGALPQPVYEGPEPEWPWEPAEEGVYRVRVVASDTLGNEARSPWSSKFTIAPTLTVRPLEADRPLGEILTGTKVRWKVTASGGVGEKNYEFFTVSREGGQVGVPRGSKPHWEWSPAQPGSFRVRAVVSDALGNRAESEWSETIRAVSPLSIAALSPDRLSPQVAMKERIRWSTEIAGGGTNPTYEYTLRGPAGEERVVQAAASRLWVWSPQRPGSYQVRVVVRDSLGNVADSGWSASYRITPPLIAILPIENLSATPAPLQEIWKALVDRLEEEGFLLLPEEDLKGFMERHRMRFTGGIEPDLAKALREEAGVGAVLITNLELYHQDDPPKFAVVSRLVETGPSLRIAWMDSAALAGDDAPGFLRLGWVSRVETLRDKALGQLAASLADHFEGRPPEQDKGAGFRPRGVFRSDKLVSGAVHTVGVLPFVNQSERRYAGDLMVLHFLEQLSRLDDFRPLELGALREQLMRYRIIIPYGVSLAEAEILFAKMDVDLLLSGKVMDYEDYRGQVGSPKVNFNVQLIDRQGGEVVWSSFSENRGDEGVFFFELGKERTAHGLAAKMVYEVVKRLQEGG